MYMFQFLDVLARGEHVEVVGPRLPKRALLTLDADDSWSDMEGTHISNTRFGAPALGTRYYARLSVCGRGGRRRRG
jgi:hypothetical protein